MVKIKLKLLNKEAQIPKTGSLQAACFDLVATGIKTSGGGKVKTIMLGIATEIPEGYKAVIVPRSSFTGKGWVLANSPAQIDSDYRGEWMLNFEAIYGLIHDFPYEIGDKVAQVYIEKVIEVEFKLTKELSETKRDKGGFGSTGK